MSQLSFLQSQGIEHSSKWNVAVCVYIYLYQEVVAFVFKGEKCFYFHYNATLEKYFMNLKCGHEIPATTAHASAKIVSGVCEFFLHSIKIHGESLTQTLLWVQGQEVPSLALKAPTV